MVKALSFFNRKSGMSVEAFQTYWRTRHPAVVVKLPGIRRYVQSHTLRSAYREGEPVYDGIAEVWFDDTRAMRALASTAEYSAVQADEAQFIARSTMGLIITEEHVVKDGQVPADGVKKVEFVTRKAGMPVDRFQPGGGSSIACGAGTRSTGVSTGPAASIWRGTCSASRAIASP